MTELSQVNIAGWREWLSLPDLHIHEIEAKVDTGTEISALHASFIEPFRQQGKLWVRFGLVPLPERSDLRMIGFAPVLNRQLIKDSEGDDEVRFVIETTIGIGKLQRTIELTLTTRDAMKFRMILGRSALQELDLLVDAGRAHLLESSKETKSQ